MTGMSKEEKPLNIRGLLGVGLDGKDDEIRITRGENFYLYGGTQETHERMVETTLKFNEKVEDRGKSLPEINARELSEIARELKEEP
ncbi:MAG: hypothetical protein PVJ27_09005 [Candidatus Brocadiaceae bacterium]|jgi:hypothetical protein